MADPNLELRRLEASDARPEFSSGDQDLDEFFHKDSILACQELLCVAYVLFRNGDPVAFYSLSNDAIRREDAGNSAIRRILKMIPHEKRYRSTPAAKIGRLGVAAKVQSDGIGTLILDYLKYSFTTGNKTGCRFLLVDSYNNPRTTAFYEKNAFQFLSSQDKDDATRIMYFDLIRFVRDPM